MHGTSLDCMHFEGRNHLSELTGTLDVKAEGSLRTPWSHSFTMQGQELPQPVRDAAGSRSREERL